MGYLQKAFERWVKTACKGKRWLDLGALKDEATAKEEAAFKAGWMARARLDRVRRRGRKRKK